MATPFSLPVVMAISSDRFKLSFLRKALRKDCHLIERQDSSSALEALQGSLIDIIIVDSDLPEIVVLDLCRAIRNHTPYAETPILLITPQLKKSYTQEALRAGVSDFINEPLDVDDIHQRFEVAQRMKKREAEISKLARKISSPKAKAPLTERELLNDKAINAIAKARKNSGLVSVLMIELDSHKNPEALVQLSEVLQRNLRKHDILIPQTPGRFILMLPKTSNHAAKAIAETIRIEITSTRLSVSIGLISFDPATSTLENASEDFQRLLEGVSLAIEEAKKTGNRIVAIPLPKRNGV